MSIFVKEEKSEYDILRKQLSKEDLFFAVGELNRVIKDLDYTCDLIIMQYKINIMKSILARKF